MRPLIKLIKPDISEALLFFVGGVSLLIISNFRRLWEHFSSGVAFSDIVQTKEYAGVVQNAFMRLESHIDPRLADFTVWMIIGVMSISVVIVFQHFIEDTTEEVEFTGKISNRRIRLAERTEYVMRLAYRFAGFLLFAIWIRLFFGAVFPQFSQDFYYAIGELGDAGSWFTIAIASLLTAVGLYTMAICLRLMWLKTRIF